MKKITLILTALFIGIMSFNSCETREPCEQNQTGDITIKNLTGYWWYFALDDYNDFILYDGDSKTYYDEGAGSHDFYYYDDVIYDKWVWGGSEYLGACKHLTYTWYSSGKKSTKSEIYVEVTNEHGEVIKTITDFKPVER